MQDSLQDNGISCNLDPDDHDAFIGLQLLHGHTIMPSVKKLQRVSSALLFLWSSSRRLTGQELEITVGHVTFCFGVRSGQSCCHVVRQSALSYGCGTRGGALYGRRFGENFVGLGHWSHWLGAT